MKVSTTACSSALNASYASVRRVGSAAPSTLASLSSVGMTRTPRPRRVQRVEEAVGGAPQRADHPARRLVLGDGDQSVGPGPVVELPEREGQQREGVAAGGFLRDALGQARLELEPAEPRRSLDDLGQPAAAERLDEREVVHELSQPGAFRPRTQELGPER